MSIGSQLNLRQALTETDIMPFIGVYDLFSASIAAKYYKGLFLSGFSFAASYYGLPDIGFISWSDIVAFAQRVKTLLPDRYILVDIDDGYVDVEVACHVVRLLESIGVSGVILEDQKRPRRCGHVDGKLLMDLDPFLEKLSQVLATRRDLFVIARTDASEIDEIVTRAKAFAQLKPDAILADGIKDIEAVKTLKSQIDLPIAFNQIAGGKSPACNLQQLSQAGVSIVNYSTPCLFVTQVALEEEMQRLRETEGFLQKDKVGLLECNALLHQNLAHMYKKLT
jgi:2-methylisocitrate lyase-like PEP mutase family enzyme